MRCPKCGRISFDYLENCSNCGQDLGGISAGLGDFTRPYTELMWFSKDSKTDSIETDTKDRIVKQGAGNSANLSEIDVEEIDSSDLKTGADDESFQYALDQVLKDE